MMSPKPEPVFVIPGMHVGCYVHDGLTLSTFECLFDSVCLNTTARWISSLSPDDWPKPLDISLMSDFTTTTSFQAIFAMQMVETWRNMSNYSAYYAECSPIKCTYASSTRSSLIYVFITLVGSCGGLIVALRTVTWFIIQFHEYMKKYFRTRKTLTVSDQRELKGCCAYITMIFNSAKQQIVSFNMFQEVWDNRLLSIGATRAYLILFTICIFILASYTAAMEHTVTITILRPSKKTFERLNRDYSLTLKCPCSEVAIPHKKMIDIGSPRFHQICHSQFITTTWTDGYFELKFANESIQRVLPQTDFRSYGKFLFLELAVYCGFSALISSKTLYVFGEDSFISAEVMTPEQFEANLDSLITEFLTRTENDMAELVALLRIGVLETVTECHWSFQSLLLNETWHVIRNLPAPTNIDECTCGVSFDCVATWEDFLCYYGNNCDMGTAVWNVPGFKQGCSHVESFCLTDLRCLFNQSCFDTLLSMYNVDMPDRLPLPDATRDILILNSSIPSRFSPTENLANILSQLMVEEWSLKKNFDAYYETCAPASCSYTIVESLNIMYVIVTIVGLIGGLSMFLRIFIKMVGQIFMLIIPQSQQQSGRTSNSEAIIHTNKRQRISHFIIRAKDTIIKVNLYKRECSLSRLLNVEAMAIIATRIYFVLLVTFILILSLFNILTQTNNLATVQSPSLNVFEELQQKYPATLLCPCRQIAVSYETFISVSVSFHQVCSSDFVSPLWITSLFGYGNNISMYQKLDRPILSKYHQIINKTCKESNFRVNNSLWNLNHTMLITATALSRASFISQTNTIINQFIEQLILRLQQKTDFISEFLFASLFPTAFGTDWILEFGNASNDYILQKKPHLYANGTCNCATSNKCNQPLEVGPPDVILPGLFVGCLPMHGLRMSTLECFYSSSCINLILSYLEYYLQSDGSPPSNFSFSTTPPIVIKPLNSSINSFSSPDTPISSLIDNLFIENWQKSKSYEQYFYACAPTACHYEYIARNNIANMISSIIAIYSGLTTILKATVWNAVRICWKKILSRKTHRIDVVPREDTS